MVTRVLARHLSPGERLGRYVIDRPIGEGAMGVVYLAHDEDLQRPVAIKVLRDDAGSDPLASVRFRREAQALANLHHPNVIRVYDFGPSRIGSFFAMQFIEGLTLGQWCRGRPWREILARFLEAGRGLAAAHRAGVLHRDFKPANVLVGRDDVARVGDFGLAQFDGTHPATSHSGDEDELVSNPIETSDEITASLTKTGTVLGTPAYMAPERFLGRPASPASDQFSFFVTLHEALFGERPFQADSLQEFVLAISGGPAKPSRPRCPPALIQVIRKGLRFKERERHASMDDALDALARVRRHPRPRAKWMMVMVAAGAVIVAGQRLASANPACETASRSVAEVWQTRGRAAVRARLLSEGTDEPGRRLQRLDREFDRYVKQWTAAYEAQCTASGEVRVGPAGAAAVACLERSRVGFEETLRVLVDSQSDSKRALGLARSLPSPSDCTELSETDTSDRDIERVIARSFALERSGQRTRALNELTAARKMITRRGSPRQQVRAFSLEGTLLVDAGDTAEAEAVLEQGFVLATEHRFDDLAASTAVRMLHVLATSDATMERSVRWQERADVWSERADDPRARANYLATRSWLRLRQQRLAEAQQDAVAARAIYAEHDGGLSPQVGRLEHSLASIALSKGDHEQARDGFARALDAFEHTYGSKHPTVHKGLQGQADASLRLGDLDDAEMLLDAADDMRELVGPLANATTEQLRGMLADKRGDSEQALRSYSAALKLLGSPSPGFKAGHLQHLVGLAKLRLRDFAGARAIFERLRVHDLEQSGASASSAATNLHNLAESEAGLNNLDRAESLYADAIEAFGEVYGAEHELLAFPLTGLGRVRLQQGRLGEAQALLERALELSQRRSHTATDWAETAFALAQTLWQRGHDRDRAVALAVEALELFSAAADREAERVDVETWLATR